MKTSEQMRDENPERLIHLHRRYGNWVIDVTLKSYGQRQIVGTVELHKETSYQRALGVFWFLCDNPNIMIREAEGLLRQKSYERGTHITIEEELARR